MAQRSARASRSFRSNLYFKRGKAKIAIALAKGRQHDKREDLRKNGTTSAKWRAHFGGADAAPLSLLQVSAAALDTFTAITVYDGPRRTQFPIQRVEQVATISVDAPPSSAASLGAPRRNVSRYRSLGSTSN